MGDFLSARHDDDIMWAMCVAERSVEAFKARTDHRPPLHDLDLPCRADGFLVCYSIIHVAGWGAYSLHDLQ